MRDLVIWSGPVNKAQVPGATVPDAVEKFFICNGRDVPPICSEVSWSFKDTDGRRLPTVAQLAGASLTDTRDIFLGAFSAGGAVLRDMTSHPEDRKLIRAMLLADGTYSGAWADQHNRIPLINDFWLQWGEYLANGDGKQMWVATASPSPNFAMANGVEVLQEIRRQIELKTGKTFTKLDHFWGVDPGPTVAYQLGSIIFAEYPLEPLAHGGHAKIAPQVWQKIMHPWLARIRAGEAPWPEGSGGEPGPGFPGAEPSEHEGMQVMPWVLLGTASLAGYFLVRWLDRRRRRK